MLIDCECMQVMGLSYGGFVAYSIAVHHAEKVDKVVIACSGVCFDESDMGKGLLSVNNIEDATSILLAQTPEKLRELMKMAFFKPPMNMPSCFLSDFIDVSLTLITSHIVYIVLSIINLNYLKTYHKLMS